ncbi:hypothetical protein [Halalkalibacter krulwichiae]|uniref:Uncharacterized protein n=1 Tax=Halalkalibacter krulwichiae TaxID=199441 RepID=A0A1X9MEJ4_9BACI|nr:hypothetical protein [Halalkalibacter krulwichiae]ARK31867.1 hypothetical protein BkAM31D_19620 [Halalkalibacter krulwichiae]
MNLNVDYQYRSVIEGLETITVLIDINLDENYKGYTGVLLEDGKNAIYIEERPDANIIVMSEVSPVGFGEFYTVVSGDVEIGRSIKPFDCFALKRLINNLQNMNGLELLALMNEYAVYSCELDLAEKLTKGTEAAL